MLILRAAIAKSNHARSDRIDCVTLGLDVALLSAHETRLGP
jgi:hypothetical protein